MSQKYFSHTRTEIVPLMPRGAKRVLEIGCGTGNTLVHLKERGLAEWIGGVEYDAATAELARPRLDWLQSGNIETLEPDLPPHSLDVILCLDVLEHLIDPWALMPRLHGLLKPGGVVISSIPNVRSRKILKDLVFRGRWEYQDSGLLDRTHLRFFTRHSARTLMEAGGLFEIDAQGDMGYSNKPGRRIRNLFFLGLAKEFYIDQFLFRARRIS